MPFEINDALSFEENLAAFAKSLEADDLKLAAVLAQKLPELLNGPHPTVGCLGRSGNRVPGADTMSGWLLQSVEIEGLRGINNEGAPLLLRLKPDCVTSISAQNGVGKSSIFDAITFAIRGIIPKLDGLAASENGRSYYVNRFHSVGAGQVTLTLVPEGGGNAVAIRVDCAANGTRTVSGPPNAEALLRDLDREFVLLDNKTFQSFIDTKDLERGRSFSGLLGLKKYSDARQSLQGLARTQPFNNHLGTNVLENRRRTAATTLQTAQRNAQTSLEALTQRKLTDFSSRADVEAAAHSSLEQIAILKAQCTGKAFDGIDLDGCLSEIKKAEGGDERNQLAKIIHEQETIEDVLKADGLVDADRDALRAIAVKREDAVAKVGSALLHEHFVAAEKVLSDEAWPDKNSMSHLQIRERRLCSRQSDLQPRRIPGRPRSQR